MDAAPPLPMPIDAMPGPPDAMPGPPDAGCVDVVAQLLANPSFDLGPGGGWQESSSEAVITTASSFPVAVQSGGYAAWLGGILSSTDALYQNVAIPAGATNMQITGYRWTDTEETGSTAYDHLRVTIRNPQNAILETLGAWSNLNTNTTWASFSFTPTGSYAGQSIRLYFESTTDVSLNTNFYLDTIALRVTVCQ